MQNRLIVARRSFRLAIILSVCSLAVVITMVGCQHEDEDDSEELTEIRTVLQKQLDYYNQLENLLTAMDTTQALDSIAKIMASDTLIESMFVTSQGINIQWSILGGSIIIRPRGFCATTNGFGNSQPREPLRAAPTNTMPQPISAKTVMASPIYSEYRNEIDPVVERINASIPRVGYDSLAIVADAQCNLKFFNSIADSGYGIIRITAHSVPWPSEENIQQVYFSTGETVNLQTTSLDSFPTEALTTRHELHVITYNDSNYFALSPQYFTTHNTFSTAPFISLAVCYSALGNWLTELVDHGALAVTGYDWAVLTKRDEEWTNNLFEEMTDIEGSPMTISQWYSRITNSYYDSAYDRYVHILYSGNPDMVLWQCSKISFCLLKVDVIEHVETSDGLSQDFELDNWSFGIPGPDTGALLGSNFYGSGMIVDGDLMIKSTIRAEFNPQDWSDNEIWVQVSTTKPGYNEVREVRVEDIPVYEHTPSLLHIKMEGTELQWHILDLKYDIDIVGEEGYWEHHWLKDYTCTEGSEIELKILDIPE